MKPSTSFTLRSPTTQDKYYTRHGHKNTDLVVKKFNNQGKYNENDPKT